MEKYPITVSGKVGYKYIKIGGKGIHIPQKEIDNLMKTLEITEDEAIDTWLFDHDYVNNEKAQILIDKAKVNKTDKLYVNDKTKRKPVERVVKTNPTKEKIIDIMAGALRNELMPELIQITNKSKLIEFTYNGKQYKLDLIEKRVKK